MQPSCHCPWRLHFAISSRKSESRISAPYFPINFFFRFWPGRPHLAQDRRTISLGYSRSCRDPLAICPKAERRLDGAALYDPDWLPIPKSLRPAGLDASIVGCLLRRCCSWILAEGCNTIIWCELIGRLPTSYLGLCWAV